MDRMQGEVVEMIKRIHTDTPTGRSIKSISISFQELGEEEDPVFAPIVSVIYEAKHLPS